MKPVSVVLILFCSIAFAEDGYKVVGYSQKTANDWAFFTFSHDGKKITAMCGPYYGTDGECLRLRRLVGKTIPPEQMHFLSPIRLVYSPMRKVCVDNPDDCEYLEVRVQTSLH